VIRVFEAALVSLVVSLLGTPAMIQVFRRHGYGQLIRDDTVAGRHLTRGNPTMGGAVIVGAALLGYLGAHLITPYGSSASGVLVLFLMTAVGAVGLASDYLRVRHQRSPGLFTPAKLAAVLAVTLMFTLPALRFSDHAGLSAASTRLSFIRDSAISLGTVGLVLFGYLLIVGVSTGVSLTDGMDGLAAGAAGMVFGVYVIVCFWQFSNRCTAAAGSCYSVRDPLDLAIVAAAAMGGCLGFLWWNAPPARIDLGDTGSLALGGALAGLAITTRTELLLVLLNGLFVVITLSVVVQVVAFRIAGRHVLRMAPLQHHFALAGWSEVTIVVRFWIISGLCVAFGLGVFYADFVARGQLR